MDEIDCQIRIADDAAENKRRDRDVVVARDRLKHIPKIAEISKSVYRRRLHSAQKDVRACCLAARDDLLKICANRRNVDALQAIIGTELHDHDRWMIGERRVETRQSIGGRRPVYAEALDEPGT